MRKSLKLLMAVLVAGIATGCSSSIDDITYPYPDSKDTMVTLEEFNQLENGMTEDEVWEIIGGKCTLTGETAIGDYEEYATISYGCNGDGQTGANVILMFQGGELTTKTQAGLK